MAAIEQLALTQDEFERKYILNPPKSLTPAEGISRVITLPPMKRVLLIVIIFIAVMMAFMILTKLSH